MKEANQKMKTTVEPMSSVSQKMETTVEPLEVQVAERITEADKAVLDLFKMKKEVALANAKAALAQNEATEVAHQNIVLRLALKYKLNDSDVIEENGTIVRKS